MKSELELVFVTGLETLLSSTALATICYCVEQIKTWDLDRVYRRQERG